MLVVGHFDAEVLRWEELLFGFRSFDGFFYFIFEDLGPLCFISEVEKPTRRLSNLRNGWFFCNHAG